jgi:hypothetical protein
LREHDLLVVDQAFLAKEPYDRTALVRDVIRQRFTPLPCFSLLGDIS